MNTVKITLVSLCFSLLVACVTVPNSKQDDSLPKPPQGYSWTISSNGIGSFLKPKSWYVKEESSKGTSALFISQENIQTNGKFITGMSINRVNNWSKTHSITPSNYAKEFAGKLSTTGEVLKKGVVKGNFPDMNIVRVKSDNEGVPTIVHNISIGMDSSDEVYILSFEAPESEWDIAMTYGSPMLNFFFLGE